MIGDKTKQVYTFIAEYIQTEGYPPTLQEIADGLGIVKSTAKYHTDILAGFGYLEVSSRHRAIQLTELKMQ